jgi:hypothetical protein
MTAIAIDWENGKYDRSEHDCAEVDHDDYPHTLCVLGSRSSGIARTGVGYFLSIFQT